MQRPFFSIIVPTYNRSEQLAACLESLSRLDYPRQRFEVIVVDDGGRIPPEEPCSRFRDRLNIELVTQPHGGPAAARNTGCSRAKGQFLVFTDDDCTSKSDWLRQLEIHCLAAPEHIVGGRTFNLLQDNPFSQTSQLIVDIVYDYYNRGPGGPSFFASNNLAIPTAGFHRIGGFDTRFTTAEDRELCDRWLNRGYRMTYAPEAVVYHAHVLTLGAFWRQHFNYGRGAFQFHQVRTQRGSGPFRPELRFYLHCLRVPFLKQHRFRAILPIFFVWQLANAAGFVFQLMKSRREPRRKFVDRFI
jgi:cellulose synthase/poly-beta-1,6-N-acetylglucosamine synthase-like glycosyltransferase